MLAAVVIIYHIAGVSRKDDPAQAAGRYVLTDDLSHRGLSEHVGHG
jgi:hypothetical protein